ncbi:MAG TPA: IS1 family transposase [Syntrophorhabdales bacterium]|nr:IS1 family transposase [Syntrophorhabdales bacterium]
MAVDASDREEIHCPRCASAALYRFGHVRPGYQRYICLFCGRQFIPGHERPLIPSRPTCAACGAGMYLFKKKADRAVFRCSHYPACRSYLTIGEAHRGDGRARL